MEQRDAIFWHYPHGVYQGAVRMGKYKLLYHYKTGESELYDLSADISEEKDISRMESKQHEKMKTMLRAWLKDNNARFPEEGVIKP